MKAQQKSKPKPKAKPAVAVKPEPTVTVVKLEPAPVKAESAPPPAKLERRSYENTPRWQEQLRAARAAAALKRMGLNKDDIAEAKK